MEGIPEKLFLQIGEDVPDDISFSELDHEYVTWCQDSCFNNDIEYVLASQLAAVTKERDELKEILSEFELRLPEVVKERDELARERDTIKKDYENFIEESKKNINAAYYQGRLDRGNDLITYLTQKTNE